MPQDEPAQAGWSWEASGAAAVRLAGTHTIHGRLPGRSAIGQAFQDFYEVFAGVHHRFPGEVFTVEGDLNYPDELTINRLAHALTSRRRSPWWLRRF